MSLNKIKKAIKIVNEKTHPGLKSTEKVQKKEDKFNKDYQKDVKKKMKDYDSAAKQEDEDSIDEPKFNAEDDEKEYHDQMEIRNGQEMNQYDREPSDRFKERAEMALKGDSKMGNDVKTGEWNPETGEGNGNTESTWGASKDDFGEELIDDIKASAKKRQDAKQSMVQLGDDIELSDRPAKKRKVAVEHTQNNKVENKRKMSDRKIKRRTFKKPFNGMGNALKLIPENWKVDGNKFVLTDKDETYMIRWDGTLKEGCPTVIQASSKTMVNEDLNKMKHLMDYNSEDTLGTIKGKERIEENESFGKVWDLTKKMVAETEEESEDDVLTEEVTGSILYKAATWKPETEEKDEVIEESDERITKAKEGDWQDAADSKGDGHAEHVMEKEEDEVNEDEVSESDEDDDLLEYVETIPEAKEVSEDDDKSKKDRDRERQSLSQDYEEDGEGATTDLSPEQSKEMDKDKDGDIDGKDLKMLRKEEFASELSELCKKHGISEEQLQEKGFFSKLRGPSKEEMFKKKLKTKAMALTRLGFPWSPEIAQEILSAAEADNYAGKVVGDKKNKQIRYVPSTEKTDDYLGGGYGAV